MAAPKQPQDHKISAAEADALKKPFHFTGLDGKTYELPHFSTTDAGLTAGFIRKNRANEIELVYTIIEALASEESLAALDEVNQERFAEIVQDWQRASGAELPK